MMGSFDHHVKHGDGDRGDFDGEPRPNLRLRARNL